MSRDMNMKAGFSEFPQVAADILAYMSDEHIKEVITPEIIKNTKRVIITGCGDSYAATLATKAFCSRMFKGRDYHPLRTIDVSRDYYFDDDEDLKQTLVIVISVSGSGARVTEAMQRATKKGCTTVALTANPEARMSVAANHILAVAKPTISMKAISAQAISYVNSVLTTILLGLYAGQVLGVITKEEADKQRAAIQEHVNKVCSEENLTSLDEQTFALADKYKDKKGYDFVGAGSDFATAYFGAAKFFEYYGSLCCLNDSEDWCHINFFMRERPLIGNIAVAFTNNNAFSRSVETINSMILSDRNAFVVTDADADAFIEGVDVVQMPKTSYEHLNPTMNFIPIAMLANYIAIKNDYEHFGGMSASNPLFSQDGKINTIKSSEIVFID